MKKKIIILLLIALAIFIFFEITNDQEEHPDVAVIEKTEHEIDSNSTKDIVPEIDAVPEIDQVRSSENISIVRKVESGENLTSILKKYGVTPTQLSKIASQEIIKFNFNNLHSGKKYKIILNADSIIISFHYQMNSSSIASITFTEKLKYSVSESTLENVNADTPIEENENEMKEELTSKNLSMKDFLTGKFEEHDHPNFILLDKQYYKSSRDMYLQKETIDAFIKMHEAAKNAGINLIIVSGSRNFKVQKGIWERKHRERKEKGMSDVEIIRDIMIWSSMPSTSRHHWGTDIDINSTDASQVARHQRATAFDTIRSVGVSLKSAIPKSVQDIFPLDKPKRKYNISIDSNLNFPSVDLLEAIDSFFFVDFFDLESFEDFAVFLSLFSNEDSSSVSFILFLVIY